MRLLIVSHTPHYETRDGIVGWAPTVREIDHLATRFSSIRHVAMLHAGPAPNSSIAYRSNTVLVPVRPSGGVGLRGKLDSLRATPAYVSTIWKELGDADFVHVRAPANISLVAMLLLGVKRDPPARWFKYAGNWQPTRRESPSYVLQRWLLARRVPRGIVTVNGQWKHQPRWIRAFLNPSLEADELERGRQAAVSKQFTLPIRALYVGTLTESKGAGRAIEVIAAVQRQGIRVELEIVGDGPDRAQFEQRVRELGLTPLVRFAGWLSPSDVRARYAIAHFVLLPSASEGWPKVLSEGMAFGALPLAGAVSSIPQYLEQFGVGAAVPFDDIEAYASVLSEYVGDPDRWARESERASHVATAFGYAAYERAVDDLLRELCEPM